MGAARHEKGGNAEYVRARRKQRVKRMTCGYCAAPLGKYKWLCDDCAAEHREKQRLQAWARRQDKLLSIAATWTGPAQSGR